MPRIIVIQLSLRTFVCGLFGALPFIGIVPGLYALVCWARIGIRYPNEWNPASDYLARGVCLALLGLGVSVLGVFAAIISYG